MVFVMIRAATRFPIQLYRNKHALVVTLPEDVSEEELLGSEIHVLREVQSSGVRAIVFDVSALHVLDSGITAGLGRVSASAALLGASGVIAGIHAEVAASMVSIGIAPPRLPGTANVDKALELIRRGRWNETRT